MPNATDKRAVFFADLDGTLIHSHRRCYDGEVLWAEYLDGKKQAFIPKRAFEVLKNFDIEIVPVTSRNPVQLNRLKDFLKQLKVRRALVNNGSLLVPLNGETDGKTKRFNLETMKDCASYAAGMEKAFHSLSLLSGIHNIYAALPCFISAAADDPRLIAEKLREEFSDEKLRMYSENHRVYISPETITKGNGVKRFCGIFNIDCKICAGDSENDISMLKESDLCFCPKDLVKRFNPKAGRIICDGFFTDDIAEGLMRRNQASLKLNGYK